MEHGDVIHDPMGEVVEFGSEVKNLKMGDRVVIPFKIACGEPSREPVATFARRDAR